MDFGNLNSWLQLSANVGIVLSRAPRRSLKPSAPVE